MFPLLIFTNLIALFPTSVAYEQKDYFTFDWILAVMIISIIKDFSEDFKCSYLISVFVLSMRLLWLFSQFPKKFKMQIVENNIFELFICSSFYIVSKICSENEILFTIFQMLIFIWIAVFLEEMFLIKHRK